MTRLVLEGLSKTYPGAASPALDRLDLTIESGTLTALLGPSGCGKTTALKLIAGLLAPDAGGISLDGRQVRDVAPDRRGVAMVFQNPLLFPHLTVAGNVGFGLKMRGVAPAEIAARVNAMLAMVQLDGLGPRRPAQLSGGQQQRAALARALILGPKLLLLDEPLSNLDAGLRDEMRVLIRELQRETRTTTLIVTHDQAEAVALSDRIALLLGGRLAQHGEPRDFYRRPATEAVARFFGGVNFLPGRVEGGQFLGPIGALPLPFAAAQGPATLTIRPEAVQLGPGPNARLAKVVECSFLGTQSRITLDLSGTMLEALALPETVRTLTPGDLIGVTLPQDALWVLPRNQCADQPPAPDSSTA
jgi:ABC-type Fe3+/spermidine/putrescine transport system ATPase subunit